ncbi:MAG: lipopolysaccharide transport periplasmic protein LptA [Rubrivivax sp.]|nr:lipopolysaccharide transport periplasmic protein LptA [Rubrivivax sp.]
MSPTEPTCPLVRRAARRPGVRAAFAGVVAAAVGLAAIAPAHAERADRTKPMVVEADRPGTVDLQRQVVVFNGNVVISQGTMVLRADRVEMREMPDGFRAASAIGASGRQASWRQRRDGPGDEIVEGVADRIEFDGKADTLRFVGNGAVRRLRGGTVADEITGATIVWDNLAEVFRVEGGAPTAANPSGRVRVILSPRAQASGADGVAGAASAGAQGAPAAPLAPARSLGGERR